jgi:hypothetical protein
MNRAKLFRILAMGEFVVLSVDPQNAAETRRLTLTEAVHLAISQNRALKIALLKVTENEHKKAGERSAYFPAITNQSNALHITDLMIEVGADGLLQLSYVVNVRRGECARPLVLRLR